MTEEPEGATEWPTAAEWKIFLENNFDALAEGMPKRPEGWWKEPAECPVCWMFEMFPLSRLH